MFYKLKIHSVVDVITNSSTVIYTYQDSSLQAAKDLFQEFLTLLGEKVDVDSVFSFGVFASDLNTYCESGYFPEELKDEQDYKQEYKNVEDIITSVLNKEMEKPNWMTEAENDYYDWKNSTSLYIKPKDEKYNALAEKALKFLNSVDADGGYGG